MDKIEYGVWYPLGKNDAQLTEFRNFKEAEEEAVAFETFLRKQGTPTRFVCRKVSYGEWDDVVEIIQPLIVKKLVETPRPEEPIKRVGMMGNKNQGQALADYARTLVNVLKANGGSMDKNKAKAATSQLLFVPNSEIDYVISYCKSEGFIADGPDRTEFIIVQQKFS